MLRLCTALTEAMERRFGSNTKSVHDAVSAGHYPDLVPSLLADRCHPDKAGAPPGSLCDHLKAMDRLHTNPMARSS